MIRVDLQRMEQHSINGYICYIPTSEADCNLIWRLVQNVWSGIASDRRPFTMSVYAANRANEDGSITVFIEIQLDDHFPVIHAVDCYLIDRDPVTPEDDRLQVRLVNRMETDLELYLIDLPTLLADAGFNHTVIDECMGIGSDVSV